LREGNPGAEALGYFTPSALRLSALLCLTQNAYVIFSIFKTLPVFRL
jgi:hypothetical protein